jgi:S-adenosylmethionine:tRNA ribosyltransferase-isomerase
MEQFQTIYARNEGAVTAPSTGLHFSREMMKLMEIHGFRFTYITLHCGLGAFDPIEVEDLTKHKMNSEQVIIPEESCQDVNNAKNDGHRICAVGVSTLRATESSVGTDGMLKPFDGWTNKFIFPPYDFGLSNALIANFYHPESTMMMATAAFAGYDITIEAYEKAVEAGYQFGCFGDALLVVDD